MSNICRRMAKSKQKAAVKAERKAERKRHSFVPPKTYTSFNIFTRDGQNIMVESKRPMTIEEAQYYYNALSISGND